MLFRYPTTIYKTLMTAIMVSTILVGCDKTVSTSFGIMKVIVLDAPFPASLATSANVTISQVEVRNQNAGADEFTSLSETVQTINLLDLQNGVTAELANLEIPEGTYDQIRLIVDAATITLVDGRTFDLTIPSGATSGLKINISPGIQIESQQTSELTLDFDVSKSFVVQGNPNTAAGINGFIFKPVIRAVNTASTGRIAGTVTDTTNTAIEGVEVSAVQDSVVSNTFTGTNGQYTLMALPSGTYTVKAEKTGFGTAQHDGISVTVGNTTTLNIQMSP